MRQVRLSTVMFLVVIAALAMVVSMQQVRIGRERRLAEAILRDHQALLRTQQAAPPAAVAPVALPIAPAAAPPARGGDTTK